MGAIKFPHASGNSMSIAAPATNPASDLELKLPATIGTAGQVLKNSSTAGTLEFGGGGKILQVVSTTKTDDNSGNVAASTWSDLGLNNYDVDITPTATSSKILISGFVNVSKESAGYIFIQLTRGGSALDGATGAASSNRPRATAAGYINNVAHLETIPFQYLDSPSSTSQQTYSVLFRHDAGSTKNITINRSYENTDNTYQARGISVITAMEVAA